MSPESGAVASVTQQGSLESLSKAAKPAKASSGGATKRKRLIWLGAAILVVLVAAGVTVGVLVSQDVISTKAPQDSATKSSDFTQESNRPEVDADDKKEGETQPSDGEATKSSTIQSSSASSTSSSSSSMSAKSKPTASACPSSKDIPKDARDTDLDTSTWLELDDFNCTYTDQTVGDLPLVGLFSDYDNSNKANSHVPALDEEWGDYSKRPARGVNVGGWLSLEPFITPSLFDYPASAKVTDEFTLCKHLGDKAAGVLEKHYSTFITEKDFKQIAEAGLDHVRIPFSYWAVETYDDDTFVPRISWRYLLRGIEWARRHGLRVKLDLHGLPGSQNGWNHSGRSGPIRFLKGSDGAKNAQRALDIHDRLSKFFAQKRYRNVIAFYGLANEPARALDTSAVEEWTAKAVDLVTKNKVHGQPVFSEGMLGVSAWAGKFPEYKSDGLVVDVHQYTIFDPYLLKLMPSKRVEYGCKEFAKQSSDSMENFGPTMVGEWSVAHNDCAKDLNGFDTGNRWEGSWPGIEGPSCPSQDDRCSCAYSNAGDFSDDYKAFLKTWAVAQMDAFEKGIGWFYWTWKTEDAPLWSYKHGLDGGFMPEKAYARDWSCEDAVPSFKSVKIYE